MNLSSQRLSASFFPLMKRYLLRALCAFFTFTGLSTYAPAQILVIPDVHGRPFWKSATAAHPDIPVIFLGDYLDPYSREGISPSEALANFKEILDFKRANMERVTLLLGNHEIHYLDTAYRFSRKDTVNAELIHVLLVDNLQLFSLATHSVVAGKSFLFTHAGVLEPWWRKFFPSVPADAPSICNALNAKMADMITLGSFIDDALMEVTPRRGGKADAGSCLWADLVEHKRRPSFPPHVYQVFGHSQQRKRPVIKKHYADLDCRRPFIINSSGKIESLSLP